MRQAQEIGAVWIRVRDATLLLEPRARGDPIPITDRIEVGVLYRADEVQSIAHHGVTECKAHLAVVAIVATGRTSLPAHLHALEVRVELEVDDTRDRIRAVARRCAARHGLDVLQEHVGERVDVHAAESVARDDPPAVEQHQCAALADTVQVQVGATGVLSAQGHLLRRIAGEYRQRIEAVDQVSG